MTIDRLPDWTLRMNQALDAAASRPFVWASWDCCHFVADVVEAMTGQDPLVEYRETYADEATAWQVLNDRDGNLRAACRRIFGNCITAPFAKRGDVVLRRGGMAIGICVGSVAAFTSDTGAGLVFVPMSDCAYAFPLGWPAVEAEPS
ncbi:DUF6950 family protein [Sandarakinorhabdus sp. DWP1-3-1]|uniref:DUF6950 family protein n=1 Tax=Sandarakinorhabdus sp. DWP1-3-1 TaxID=2804627 RepID=UPI003CEEC564